MFEHALLINFKDNYCSVYLDKIFYSYGKLQNEIYILDTKYSIINIEINMYNVIA